MADRRPPITDRNHLDTLVTRIATHLARATNAWLTEDANACLPRPNPDAPTTRHDDQRDPNHHYRHRDQIGHTLLAIDAKLTELIRNRETITPNRPCTCCRSELATHGRDEHAQPVLCWPCHAYLRRMGYPCRPKIHDTRPRIRMCECPPSCCDVCPDRAEEGRTVSRRCRARKANGLWDRATA